MDYAIGELAEERQQDVKSHLDDCLVCLESYQEISGALDSLGVWEVAPAGPDLTARTLAALDKEREDS